MIAIEDRLAVIVGRDNVLDHPDIIDNYSRDYSLERAVPFTCVVRPRTVAETKQIIQLANEVKFAVVPQSSGVHFNGCALPKRGGVILDLSQMNDIVAILKDSMVAHLQVGVNWEQFHSALEAEGYKSVIPLLPHASRSVIMDWLEREPPVVQNHECSGPLRSMQIIWGNNELFVSGSASIGNFRTVENLATGIIPAGPGPISYDTFLYGAQGTMGVVTWGVVQFEEIPTLTKTFFIPTDRVEDVIEPLYMILRRGVCNECLLLNNINLATIFTKNWPEPFAQFRATLPPWMVILVSTALKRHPEEKMAYQEEFLHDIMSTHFNELELLTTLPGLPDVEKRLPDMLRKPWPKDKTYWKHAYKGGCQDLMFMTTLDRVEKYLLTVVEVAIRHHYSVSDIGCYIQPVEDGRACQLQFNFYYNPYDEAEKEKTQSLYTAAASAAIDRGAYFTRPYRLIADMVYRKNRDYSALLKRLKKHFDPNGILNPRTLCF